MIRETIQTALEKHECFIEPGALDYFVQMWNDLCHDVPLNALNNYVWVLSHEFGMGKKAEGWGNGWEIWKSDIDELKRLYLQPDLKVWNEGKKNPEKVQLWKEHSQKPLSFGVSHEQFRTDMELRDVYPRWLRISAESLYE